MSTTVSTGLHGAAYLAAVPDEVAAPLERLVRAVIDTDEAEKAMAQRVLAVVNRSCRDGGPEMASTHRIVQALSHTVMWAQVMAGKHDTEGD